MEARLEASRTNSKFCSSLTDVKDGLDGSAPYSFSVWDILLSLGLVQLLVCSSPWQTFHGLANILKFPMLFKFYFHDFAQWTFRVYIYGLPYHTLCLNGFS